MLSSRKNQSVITLYFILGFVKGQEKTNIIYKKVFFGGSYVVLPQKVMGYYRTLYRYRTYRRRVFRVLACICCRCGLRGCVYLFVYEYVKKGMPRGHPFFDYLLRLVDSLLFNCLSCLRNNQMCRNAHNKLYYLCRMLFGDRNICFCMR